MCGDYKYNDLKMVIGSGGLVAYLGTNSVKKVEEMINTGDHKAKEVLEAMCYQVSKEIGAMATVFSGDVNTIIFTGGIAHSSMVTTLIEDRVKYIASVVIYPGEDEMKALAHNGLRVLSGEIEPAEYKP